MKNGKKLLITASLVSTAVTMGGCRFLPWMNNDQPLYGVPMDPRVTLSPIPGYGEEDDRADFTPAPEEDETFSPEDNLAQCMYGPPPNKEIIRNGEE